MKILGVLAIALTIGLSTMMASAAALTAAEIKGTTNLASETWQFGAQGYLSWTQWWRTTYYDNDPATWWGAGWSGWRYPNNEGEGFYGNTSGEMKAHPYNTSGMSKGSVAVFYLVPAAGTYSVAAKITYLGGGDLGMKLYTATGSGANLLGHDYDTVPDGFHMDDPDDILGSALVSPGSPVGTISETVTVSAGDYIVVAIDNGAAWGNDNTRIDSLVIGLIPEPVTVSLLAAGGLALLRRKRR